jgi:pimeloyl-ACP methyl ester carboxylesterase
MPWLLTDVFRGLAELALMAPGMRLIGRMPEGDGHPVLVMPGMGASDLSTAPLRKQLGRMGYVVYGWAQGRNVGDEATIAALEERLADIRARHHQPVSLIGWSLGGIYARELAKRAAEDVRVVITLGSPFKGPYKASHVRHVYEALSGTKGSDARSARFAAPPPVPTTAVFSRQDGIVAWQRCVEPPAAQTESVEVPGSHCGLGYNVLALYVIADRLAQPVGQWRPFEPSGVRGVFYRDPWRDGIPANCAQGGRACSS